MAGIKFACPKCGQNLEAPLSREKIDITCSSCGYVTTLSPPQEKKRVEPEPVVPRIEQKISSPMLPFFIVVVIVLMLTVSGALVWLFFYTQPSASAPEYDFTDQRRILIPVEQADLNEGQQAAVDLVKKGYEKTLAEFIKSRTGRIEVRGWDAKQTSNQFFTVSFTFKNNATSFGYFWQVNLDDGSESAITAENPLYADMLDGYRMPPPKMTFGGKEKATAIRAPQQYETLDNGRTDFKDDIHWIFHFESNYKDPEYQVVLYSGESKVLDLVTTNAVFEYRNNAYVDKDEMITLEVRSRGRSKGRFGAVASTDWSSPDRRTYYVEPLNSDPKSR